MKEWGSERKKTCLGDCAFFFFFLLSLSLSGSESPIQHKLHFVYIFVLHVNIEKAMTEKERECVCLTRRIGEITKWITTWTSKKKTHCNKILYVHMKYEVNENENREQHKCRQEKSTKPTEQILYNSKLWNEKERKYRLISCLLFPFARNSVWIFRWTHWTYTHTRPPAHPSAHTYPPPIPFAESQEEKKESPIFSLIFIHFPAVFRSLDAVVNYDVIEGRKKKKGTQELFVW